MRIICFFIFSVFAFPLTVNAERIRIGAWNIQDLHHKEKHHLRDFGGFKSVRRNVTDYELLNKYRDKFGKDETPADIIALQEIGTKAALNKLFPSSLYKTIISPRWINDDALAGQGDVYTAIAVRKASGIKFVEEINLPELGIFHTDGRRTRAGTGAILEIGGSYVAFLSVHLKSSCAETKNPQLSTNDDCETLWAQMPILHKWIKKVKSLDIPVIIAGDFNRRFRSWDFKDPIFKAINGVAPKEKLTKTLFSVHPLTITRGCPTRKGLSTQPIDWILVDKEISSRIIDKSFWERRFTIEDINRAQFGKGLSDHCPISLDIDY